MTALVERPDWRKVRQPADPYERFHGKVAKRGPDECWIWMGATTSHGYGVTQWNGRVQMAHRIAFLLEYGLLAPDFDVLHHCDNPPCVNPNHLFSGDAKSNAADMIRKGRGRYEPHRGSANGNSRYTEEVVRHVLASRGLDRNEVAARWGMPPTTVGDIWAGRTWRHLR